MGSYNIACQITHTPITYKDDAVLVFVKKNTSAKASMQMYVTDDYEPVSLPFFVKYRDYGRFELDASMSPANTIAWQMLHLAATGAGLPMTISPVLIELVEKDDNLRQMLSTKLYKDEDLHLFEDFDLATFNRIFDVLQKGDDRLGYMVIDRKVFDELTQVEVNKYDVASVIDTYASYDPTSFENDNFQEPEHNELCSIGKLDPITEGARRFFYVVMHEYLKDNGTTIGVFVLARAFYDAMKHLNVPYARCVYAGELWGEDVRAAKIIAELNKFKSDFPDSGKLDGLL